LLPRKLKDSNKQNKSNSLYAKSAKVTFALVLLCSCTIGLLCWFGTCSFSTRPSHPPVLKAPSSEPNVVETAKSAPAEYSLVEQACGLIYQGKFNAAGELIEQAEPNKPELAQLTGIVKEYKALNKRRQSAKEASYHENLAELQKLEAVAKKDDPNDPNDVNEVTEILPVIARVSEFADDTQRKELLSSLFVKQTLQRAIDESAELEFKSEWLDAYTSCYFWLQVIDPNNEAYSDYAELLLDRAGIAASLQDSPCETRQQRYKGIKKRMFSRAIDVLDTSYVSHPLDYGQMAVQGIKRCTLLADVMASLPENAQQDVSEGSFVSPEPNKINAFSAALEGLRDEIDQSETGLNHRQFIKIFEKVLALNETTVQLPESELIAHFAEAALSALDPYTVMIWPKQIKDFEKDMTNKFTGIGVEITKEKGLLTVASLLLDTPAFHSGLDAGDVIEAVDGIETKGISLRCAVQKITGPEGTKVTLTVRRPGEEETRYVTITRARILVPTIRGWRRTPQGEWLYMIDEQNKIGFVRLTSRPTGFSERTASDLEKVLDQLEEQGMEGLILDLRFNAGGFFDSAIAVADKFLKEGLIVKRQPGFGRIPSYEMAHKEGIHPDYPLVVLINQSSASASEIVAGALADEKHERAVLVGERTHGKGSVQAITHYPREGAQLKYTMAHYHLPSGQRVKSREEVQKKGNKDWGVRPDIQVALRSDELKKMFDVQRANDVLFQASRHEGDETLEKYTAEETIAADPQLAVALLVIKAKLVEASALASAVN
jgi:carboxyl-terminal processing protease